MTKQRGQKSKKSLRVLFCASEVAPFEKTGGLADVAGSLPVALGKLGVEILVMMPKYRNVRQQDKQIAPNVKIHFVENEEYFNRSGLYGNDRGDYPDNLQRFSFFCHEALSLAKAVEFKPDIVHAHDWQTALLPVLLKKKYQNDPFFKNTKTLLSIHNIAYQGHFPHSFYEHLGLDPSLFSVEGFEFYGKINLLKAGALFADRLSTVSPTYAKEIQTKEFGFGLEGVMERRAKKLHGILNGIDTTLWDPVKDKRIAANFSKSNLAGKHRCKAALQKACGFEVNPDIPLFGMVTRLAEQKGLELVSEIADNFLSENVQFVLLGDGDSVYHTAFGNIGKRHPKNARMFLRFDVPHAHQIYAGSDFFLMPSYFEPCGLGQMIAMRYGTVPMVRKTGGLADTVSDIQGKHGMGTGYVFKERAPEKLWQTIRRGLSDFKDTKKWSLLQQRLMSIDFSWKKSAAAYFDVYQGLVKA